MINEQALKDRLQTIAKEKEIPFNACWKQLLLERFLARLARSSHVNKFIFKGGFLLSYMMKIGRETVDLDFLLTRMNAEVQGLQEVFEEIASISSNDGFTFSFESIELLSQPHMEYPGYRTIFKASFAKMKDKIHVDVGVGDVVEPQNREIKLFEYRGKPFFEESISLLVYPIETIFAEKLETVLSKGSRNSRMKDFHDLLLLLRDKSLHNSKTLRENVNKTFENRGTTLKPIQFDEAGHNSGMRIGEIGAMISNINNVQVALNSAAGAALMVELRMRLIGELSQPVRDKLLDLVDTFKKNNPKKKHVSDNYWNCDLSYLDDAIVEVFKNQLDNIQLQKLDGFRKLRNKLLHADFVGLMEELGISPTGRQILDPMNDKRNLLTSANIKESVLSVSSPRTRGLQTVEREAKEVNLILDKLIFSLAVPG